jgi:tetratricopeptide (TPR) repeat protein
VRGRLADLELLDRLENIRLNAQTAVKDGHFDWKGADDLYGRTFQDAGFGVENLPMEEVAERFRRTTVADELAAALDQWAMVRRNARPVSDTSWKHLLRVARRADPDAGRTQVREALARRDSQALREAAASEEVFRLPVATLCVLGYAFLMEQDLRGQAEAFLREAQRRHPGDFWLNHILFMHFRAIGPHERQEAVRFAALAVALRPASPAAHFNLASVLKDNGQLDEAAAEFRQAIAVKKDYVEAHRGLGNVLLDQGKMNLAIAAYQEAIRINDNDSNVHNNLGHALRTKRKFEQAIAEFRKALQIDKNNAYAHNNFGIALFDRGQLEAAIREFRQALQLRKNFPEVHINLGGALVLRGQLNEAIAEFRKALQANHNSPEAHLGLGNALWAQGKFSEAKAEFQAAVRIQTDVAEALYDKRRLDEAIAEFRKGLRLKPADAKGRAAIDLNKDYAKVHYYLGVILQIKGRVDEAIDEWHAAIRLNNDIPEAHYNLGRALSHKGRLDEAAAEYREAIRIKKDKADAHCNLGRVLQLQGKFAEALDYLRRGHELGSPDPRWPYASARWVKECERLLELDRKLPAILSGRQEPVDGGECLALAQLCQLPGKKLYATAFRFYKQAFAAEPKLTGDQPSVARYNAARAAALAGCGSGNDAGPLDEKTRAGLRWQALDLSRADLTAWNQFLKKDVDKARLLVVARMLHWRAETDFAGVRGDALAKFPAAERQAWQKLWADVDDTLTRAHKKMTLQ